jgi:hypothetical protein
MDSDAALEERQNMRYLRELSIVFAKARDGTLEHVRDHVSLFIGIELELGHL